jgi:hypothetical protein
VIWLLLIAGIDAMFGHCPENREAIPSRSGTGPESPTDARLRDHTDRAARAILENWPQDLHFWLGEGQDWSVNLFPN